MESEASLTGLTGFSLREHPQNCLVAALITCEVPQDYILGPVLFLLYMLPLDHIMERHNESYHSYADNIKTDIHITKKIFFN